MEHIFDQLCDEIKEIKRLENGGKSALKVRINYKSGISEEFWAWKLEITRNPNGGISEIKWEFVSNIKPTFINVEEIESVWQVGYSILTRYEVEILEKLQK
jgi:hypothetical protein